MATEYPEVNKAIKFFKVIVTENHPQGELVKPCMLPIKFVKKYGKIWFGEGWKEFAQYYSLGHGHFLVFKYQRLSEFHDTTSLEIDYPSKRVEAEKVSSNEEEKS